MTRRRIHAVHVVTRFLDKHPVRSKEKAKPKGRQKSQNGKALFTQTFLYMGIEWRLSRVVVIVVAVGTVNVGGNVGRSGSIVLAVVVVVVVVVTRRRHCAAVRW
jgi:hypothetical protein